ncbi:MAG TPA: trehalose-6-phosphate synthase, partial [Terrimesophilobacter sp.]|nr:trehalose-6-phosphate synthase [Terrimesophilobacter sp.]
ETAAIAAPGATVWVHDYQLQLVPRLLRELRPDLTIGYFHHIPFPPYGIFSQLPWRRQIIMGLLGADVVGFQRAADAANFVAASKRLNGATPETLGTRVKHVPISIDAAS